MIRIVHTPAIDKAKAETLAKTLAKYKVGIRGLRVWFCNDDGVCKQSQPLATAISQMAASTVAGVVSAPAMAPIAVPVAGAMTALLGPLALPAMLGVLGAEFVASHEFEKRKVAHMIDGKPLAYSIVEFDLKDVSSERRGWTEYLLSAWAINTGGIPDGLEHPEQYDAARRFIARYGHGAMPIPWGERKGAAKPRGRKAATSRTPITKRKRAGLWAGLSEFIRGGD